jgi:microcystin-dependent protein
MPQHYHTNTAVSTVPPHKHTGGFRPYNEDWGTGESDPGHGASIDTGEVDLEITTTVTIDPEGENQAHTNTQPTIGCYYIMYIPV